MMLMSPLLCLRVRAPPAHLLLLVLFVSAWSLFGTTRALVSSSASASAMILVAGGGDLAYAQSVQHTLQLGSSSLHKVWNVYQHQLSVAPLPTKMLTGATLAVVGDALAQQQQGTKTKYCVRRASSFAIFDMAYRAMQHGAFPIVVRHCQGHVLAPIAAIVWPHQQVDHAAAAMEQALASQLVLVPLFYYPIFFALTGALQGLDLRESWTRARDNFVPLMQRNLLYWIPVQYAQFAAVPKDLQIPFLSCAGLFWTFLLSMTAGSAQAYVNSTTTNSSSGSASENPESTEFVASDNHVREMEDFAVVIGNNSCIAQVPLDHADVAAASCSSQSGLVGASPSYNSLSSPP